VKTEFPTLFNGKC